MKKMNRSKALDLVARHMIVWPHTGSLCVVEEREYRGSGWHWMAQGRDAVLVRGSILAPITASDWQAHKQGDPNAHESVRSEYSKADAKLTVNGKRHATGELPDNSREPAEWDGEGLPPVGAVVEVHVRGEWRECDVIAHFQQCRGVVAAFTISQAGGSKSLDYGREGSFRPIRSEREKAVAEAMKAIDAEDGDVASIIGVVERMVAAGYRKTEGA